VIRYPVSRKDLESMIEAQSPDWLHRVKARTDEFRNQGFYEEKTSIWSEVKPVYMRLQGDSKCAYCERQLEDIPYGTIEQDLEHFRPKKRVKPWPAAKSLRDRNIPFTKAPNQDRGYFLLPYHIFNYSTVCKPCNSILKKNYFPIAGRYNLDGENARALSKEKPYLIYPIGNVDDDPATLIKFSGASPQPVARSGHKRNRALVTIDFFKLDDLTNRKNLFRDRVMMIVALYPQLENLKRAAGAVKQPEAKKLVEAYTKPTAPHTNCARSFERLYRASPKEAGQVFASAVQLITSIS
jgi:hypothetical protein